MQINQLEKKSYQIIVIIIIADLQRCLYCVIIVSFSGSLSTPPHTFSTSLETRSRGQDYSVDNVCMSFTTVGNTTRPLYITQYYTKLNFQCTTSYSHNTSRYTQITQNYIIFHHCYRGTGWLFLLHCECQAETYITDLIETTRTQCPRINLFSYISLKSYDRDVLFGYMIAFPNLFCLFRRAGKHQVQSS